MRFRHMFVISLIFLLPVLVVGGITAFANTGSTVPQSRGMQEHHNPTGPLGMPAITPRIHAIPAFTAEDVKLYYQNHNFSAGPTVSGAPPTIKSIRFMTSGEARVLLKGEVIGIPDSAMVCYVQLHGPFYPTMVSVPPGQALPATVDRGFEVFGADTGNLLLWGLA